MSGFIIGVYQRICYMEGIVEQLFHKQTADGFAGSYHMIDQSSENRKLDKILKELVVFTRCLLQGTEAWWIDQHDLAEMVGTVTVSHDRKEPEKPLAITSVSSRITFLAKSQSN